MGTWWEVAGFACLGEAQFLWDALGRIGISVVYFGLKVGLFWRCFGLGFVRRYVCKGEAGAIIYNI